MNLACRIRRAEAPEENTFRPRALFVLCLAVLFVAAPAWPVEVLVDQAHGQRFLIEGDRPLDLSNLAEIFRKQGAAVRSSGNSLSAGELAGVDIVLFSGPFVSPAPEEVAAILDFLRQGGHLVVMAHIAQPLVQLLDRLGVGISLRPVLEREHIVGGQATDFSVVDLAAHPLLKGIVSFNMYGAWALLNRGEEVKVLARTSIRAWLDLDGNGMPGPRDPVRSFPLVVTGGLGKGTFVVFGDDAVFQNKFLAGGNLQLARNLADWLCPVPEKI